MPTMSPIWIHTVFVCENTGPDHDRCTKWRFVSEHHGADSEPAYTTARNYMHARVIRHTAQSPVPRLLAFEHRTDGRPCAACQADRAPCTDTPTGTLFLCGSCLALLDIELRRAHICRPRLNSEPVPAGEK